MRLTHKIWRLSLFDMTSYSTTYSNLVPHYMNTEIVKMGAEYLIPRVIMAKAIAEVTHYYFYMTYLTVTPRHVKIPYQ